MSLSRTKLAAAAAILLAAGGLGVYLWRLHSSPRVGELLGFVPPGGPTTMYCDVSALSSSGVLENLVGSASGEDADYREFTRATGFDYREDLDRFLLWRAGDTTYIVAVGRFDLPKLEQYAKSHEGRCAAGLCSMPGSTPGRFVSFRSVGRGTIALASGPEKDAAKHFADLPHFAGRAAQATGSVPPDAPLWIHLPPSAMTPVEGLPLPFQLLMAGLSGAKDTWFSATAGGKEAVVSLKADFPSASDAENSSRAFRRATELLRVARRLKGENADDPFAKLLTSGDFRAEGPVLTGTWRLRE